MFLKAGSLWAVVLLLACAAASADAQGTDAKVAAAEDYHTNPKFLAAV